MSVQICAKTQSFTKPNQVVCVLKTNKTLSTVLSKHSTLRNVKFEHIKRKVSIYPSFAEKFCYNTYSADWVGKVMKCHYSHRIVTNTVMVLH